MPLQGQQDLRAAPGSHALSSDAGPGELHTVVMFAKEALPRSLLLLHLSHTSTAQSLDLPALHTPSQCTAFHD